MFGAYGGTDVLLNTNAELACVYFPVLYTWDNLFRSAPSPLPPPPPLVHEEIQWRIPTWLHCNENPIYVFLFLGTAQPQS
jgi:hypothetical protein